MPTDISSRLDDLRKAVEQRLGSIVPEDRSSPLYDAVAYVLEGSGKRLRPLLVLATAESFGARREAAMPAALAVEVFHNFTLVHDDIMDRSASRRGKPTVHERWGESIGILAGDYLLAQSFDLLRQLEREVMGSAIERFHQMVVRLCEGQAMDTMFERLDFVSTDEYMDMVSRKTGALIEASLALGGLVAGVAEPDLSLLAIVGSHAGLAFQIQDDLLDLTSDSADWGKPVGADLMVGKKSFLTVKGLEHEQATGEVWFVNRMSAGGVAPEEIDEARQRLQEMGVLGEAELQIEKHYFAALDTLSILGREADLSDVAQVIERLLTRNA